MTIRTSKTSANCELPIANLKTVDSQSGAALVALLALMTITALLMLAAAPSIYMDVQRGREEEAIRRGEEVAEAIRLFARYRGTLPKSMDELLEGVSIPGRTKKRMILRESAAKDPLSSSGEWIQVQEGDFKTIGEFQRKLADYTGSQTFSNPEPRQVFDRIAAGAISSIKLETSEDTDPPGGEDDSKNIDAPFVAVRSRSQRKSVIAYYGIERNDRWLFTPLFRGTGNQQNVIPGPPPPPPPPEE